MLLITTPITWFLHKNFFELLTDFYHWFKTKWS